jgi:hypothetical protein
MVKSNIIQGDKENVKISSSEGRHLGWGMNASEMKGETNQIVNFLLLFYLLFLCTFKKNTAATPLPPLPAPLWARGKTCLSLSVGKLQFRTPNHRTNYKSESFLLRRLHIRTKKLFKISKHYPFIRRFDCTWQCGGACNKSHCQPPAGFPPVLLQFTEDNINPYLKVDSNEKWGGTGRRQ